jgi:single-stranded-DNA-specific exonuclease
MRSEENSQKISPLTKKILAARGVKTAREMADFLAPDYAKSKHDPFLFPDMKKACARILRAIRRGEKITIYGDYDIDGMTATVILWESLRKFGANVETYTPDRFTEGYGMNLDAVEKIASDGTKLIITVDNGTLSFDEIARAKELGVDVIVTDHHSPHETLPDAVAILNPKILVARNPEFYDEKFCLKKFLRKDFPEKSDAQFAKIAARAKKLYPFCDLCGAGVAFKLVQAMQTTFNDPSVIARVTKQSTATRHGLPRQANLSRNDVVGLPDGQEKWLLDLVALGTVCDVVGLVDENRANVKWGLEVLKKTRRPGLRALLATAGADIAKVDARTLGFVLGPRLNAAGRLETAKIALELFKTDDNLRALELAEKLEKMNQERRAIQDEIFVAACAQMDAENLDKNPVAIAVGDDWHEGVIGIVAAKILEKFEKPAFVLSRGAEFAKGSGRSFGEFSCAAAIHATDEIIEKGGGHLAAGGLTVRSEKIDNWRDAVQAFYKSLNLGNQREFLYPRADVTATNFADLTPELLDEIAQLEPFGHGNEPPIFEVRNVLVFSRRTMGKENQHVKYVFADENGVKFTTVAFSAATKFQLESFDAETGAANRANIRVELMANEWNGRVSVEGKLIRLEPISHDE